MVGVIHAFLIAQGENRTVYDDDARDVLTGGCGLDWFVANLEEDEDDGVLDRITDLKDAGFADDPDWILSP